MPREGLVPDKSEFRPERSPALLPKINLADVHLAEPPAIRFRLISTEIQERLKHDFTGQDYLATLPDLNRKLALHATHAIFEQPCGLWLVFVTDYPGYEIFLELTIFPMTNGKDKDPILFTLAHELPGSPAEIDASKLKVRTEGSVVHAYIDAGAGLPVFKEK